MSSVLVPVVAALPWLLGGVVLALLVRLPRALPAVPARRTGVPGDLVSVIVPARNEARNIEAVLRSLTATRGVAFEIVVVDDRSDDDTAALARSVDPGTARRLVVLQGDPLPDGWFGKPWACHQGAREARGDVLLFTDADTVHGAELLARALAGLHEDEAAAVTVVGRQVVDSFWERLVQPQVFTAMLARYPRQVAPLPPERWRDAIANGQYILIRRDAYQAVGGHEALKGEVAEDLRMAQRLVRAGHRLSMRRAEDALATRMYHSLGELVEGWSKNLVLGGLATLPPGPVRALAPALFVLVAVVLWLVPPATLLAAGVGLAGPGLLLWSALATGASVSFWAAISLRFGAPPWYGVLYPLGAAVVCWIMVRAWVRGGKVAWKGREYRVGGPGE